MWSGTEVRSKRGKGTGKQGKRRSVGTEFYSVSLTWHSLTHYFYAKLLKIRKIPNIFVTLPSNCGDDAHAHPF